MWSRRWRPSTPSWIPGLEPARNLQDLYCLYQCTWIFQLCKSSAFWLVQADISTVGRSRSKYQYRKAKCRYASVERHLSLFFDGARSPTVFCSRAAPKAVWSRKQSSRFNFWAWQPRFSLEFRQNETMVDVEVPQQWESSCQLSSSPFLPVSSQCSFLKCAAKKHVHLQSSGYVKLLVDQQSQRQMQTNPNTIPHL